MFNIENINRCRSNVRDSMVSEAQGPVGKQRLLSTQNMRLDAKK